ncbi:MAG: Ig-like domain repeat protein [Clostridiales Family XIII bacterium]|nr:Ig-like domain repeat protein [Clostridiales Family XIII bacterium]
MLLALSLAFPYGLPLPAKADGVGAQASGDVVAAPQFTRHPADSTYSEGAAARFYVRAASTDGGYLTYAWHRSAAYDAPVANASATGAAQDGVKATGADETIGTDSVLDVTTPTVSATTYYYYWVTVTNHRDIDGDGNVDDDRETTSRDSAFALTKVVNRALEPKIMNGDFQTFNGAWPWTRSNTLDTIPLDTGRPNSGIANPQTGDLEFVPYWDTTQDATTSNMIDYGKTTDMMTTIKQPENHAVTPDTVMGLVDTTDRPFYVELASGVSSSLYQEVATVPGKIYEWSIDHVKVTSSNEIIAVVIGPALNEKSDYGSTTNRWVDEANYNRQMTGNAAATSLPKQNPTGYQQFYSGIFSWEYPYGKNTTTYFNDIVNTLGNASTLTALSGQSRIVRYNNANYYVYISQASDTWATRSDVYTVPEGQGTTVFGFVAVSPAAPAGNGNGLDNIKFASGSDLAPTPDIAYSGDTSISTHTKSGYAYALAEVRGSSVIEQTGLSAFYTSNASGGSAGSAVAPTTGLGAGGWYSTDSSTGSGGAAFSDSGAITFKDLVPGKTYRIIGIPIGAINTGLHTNESAGGVLDPGYYRDVKIPAAYVGDDGDLPSYDLEVYDDAGGGGRKARVTLVNASAQVQYAILAGDDEAPDTGSGSGWKDGSGAAVFDGLGLGATYWLVARAAGYTEVAYADAAYEAPEVEGGEPRLVALPIPMPPAGTVDMAAADVSRAPGGTPITVRAEGVREGYGYALADPVSGQIASGPVVPGGGSPATFTGLDPTKTYQVVFRPEDSGAWLRGVRVYPYATPLSVDFAAEAVGSSAGGTGFIPSDTEYRVQASGGAAAWLIGDGSSWRRAAGSARLELAQGGVADDGRSIFGAMDDAGASGATVTYRLAITDGYTGAGVQPEASVTAPARPQAPVAGAWGVDFAGERLAANAAALEWREAASPGYTGLAAGASVGFEELGWSAAAGAGIDLRYPASSVAFASHDTETMLPGRPDAPEGLTSRLVDIADPGQGITVMGLDPLCAYQYSLSTDGARSWTDITGVQSVTLDYYEGSDWDVRYSATDESPASFYVTVSSPLSASVLNLGSATYGEVGTALHELTINNIIADPVELAAGAVTLSGPGSEYFTLNAPGAVSVPGATELAVGQSKAWAIAPAAGIPAGNYTIQVNIAYSHGGNGYTCHSNVYFTVNKANWGLGGIEADTQDVTAESFGLAISGAPEGARLSYRLGGGAYSAEDAAVGPDGMASHVFPGLAAARGYVVRVRASGDADHNEAPDVALLTAYTAQATPTASAVAHVNFTDEALVYNSGYSPAGYAVTVKGGGDGELGNLASVTELASAGDFTLNVVRRAGSNPPYPASAADTLEVAGRGPAPGSVGTTKASDDNASDGTITCAGIFQYRAGMNGADVTSGWTNAYNTALVTPGRYEVRYAPSATAFASAITTVRVGSEKPTVTLFTKTYVPQGGGEPAVPGYLYMPDGWIESVDPDREGEYDHSYLTSPMQLPSAADAISRSHVLAGWYGDEGLTSGPVTETPAEEEGEFSHHDYWAKWVVRPTVTAVHGAAPSVAAGTASQGLVPAQPVRLSVALPAGAGSLSPGDLGIAGQSGSVQAQLYSDADFAPGHAVSNLPLAWVGDTGYPAHAWLKTVSSDDDATAVYYELTLSTTRQVSFIAGQSGGAPGGGADDPGVRTTTDISLTFDYPVSGLTAGSIELTDGTGHAVKGELTGAGTSYTLSVTGVAQGGVDISVSDWEGYDVTGAPQQATVYRDGTAPTGSVTVEGNAFAEFFNKITFGLFFNETADVDITAIDEGGDGLVSLEYLKVSEAFDTAAEVNNATGWQSGDIAGSGSGATGSAGFSVEPNEKFFAYARMTDAAGNLSIIGSDGVVVYTDSAASDAHVGYTKLSGKDVDVNVTLNGNVIDTVSLDGAELTEGEDYTVPDNGMGNVITLKSSYLDTLSAGAIGETSCGHGFLVSYRPLGERYAAGGGLPGPGGAGTGKANDAPDTTGFTVEVSKAEPTLALSVPSAQQGGAVYGEGNVTLRVTIDNSGAAPGGTVNFYDGSLDSGNLLGGGPVGVDPYTEGRGRASVAVTLPAGPHTILAVYSGDGNYAAAMPAPLAGYNVTQADQGALAVKEGAEAVTGLDKKREDVSFALAATGGVDLPGNDYVWSSTDPSVATITTSGSLGENATVNIIGKGEATIIVTRAGDSNHYAALPANVALSVAEETTLPVAGGAAGGSPDSALAVSDLGETGLTLSWAKAADAFPAMRDNTLRYFVYRSASDNIRTPEDCAANGGIPLNGAAGSTDIATFAVGGLEADTPYWFNVVVADEAGNKAAYTGRRVVTPLKVSVLRAVQHGGKNGRAPSTGILLTFDKDVTGFEGAHVDVSIGGGAANHGAITDAGDGNAKTWLVTKSPSGAPEWTNGAPATVGINGWSNASNGHSYFFESDPVTLEGVTLYAPDAWPTPAAVIDFVGERLTGLEPGGVYVFAAGSGSFGDERTIEGGGVYDHMPYSLPSDADATLRVLRKGVSEGAILTDDDPGHEDSPVQSIAVPARPTAPAGFATNDPATEGGKGGLTGVGADMEYRSVGAGGEAAGPWTTIVGSSVADITPGAYHLREKAVAASRFASSIAPFYIHAFGAVSFDSALECYSVGAGPGQIAPKDVSGDGGTITGVSFIENPDDNFVLSGSGADWTIKPKEKLTRGEYKARIRLAYDNSTSSEQEASFIVRPFAGIASAAAISSAGPGGPTDTLAIKFIYPIDLAFSSVVIGGAAHKLEDTEAGLGGFAGVSADKTLYTLKAAPLVSYKTGDPIDVTVNLDSTVYALQISKTNVGSLSSDEAKAVIPRGIEKAEVIRTPDGWSSFILQFTFDKSLTPTDPAGLVWYGGGSYDGPVRLYSSEGGAPATNVAISGVYSVTADEGWTYRVTLDVSAGGPLYVGLPGWGVGAAFAGDAVKGADNIAEAAFFLDGEGHNYITNLKAEQVLPAADARGGYVAPAYGLYTSNEYGVGGGTGAKEVYLDGGLLDPGLWSAEGVGPAPFIFDGGAPEEIKNQLVVTLAEDWTRAEGEHTVMVVFGDGSVAQGVITLEGVTATWPLALLGSEGATGFAGGTGGGGTAVGDYGTADGCFVAGTGVKIEAVAPLAGWRFDAWEQTSAGAVVTPPTAALPEGSPGLIGMPAEALELTALYTDGVAPVSTLGFEGGGAADGAWTSDGLLTLSTVDDDVREATGGNASGAGLGVVASVSYRIDSQPEVTVPGSEAVIDLGAIDGLGDGAHSIAYRAADAAGNAEAERIATVGYDTTAPGGSVQLRGLEFGSFLPSPSFVRFYRGDVAVEIEGSDETPGSGVAGVEYLTRAEAFGSEAEAKAATGWIEADDFQLNADGASIIYARVTDRAGNVRVVNTDGVVRYTDSALASGPPTFTRTSAEGVSAGLALNGNTVAGVKLGGGLLDPGAYSVAGDTLTFSAAYLNGLAAPETGSYDFTVSISPHGHGYVADGSVGGTGGGAGSGNNAPAEIHITLPMAKAVSALSFSAEPEGGAVFGNSTLLSASVAPGANGAFATGEVSFFDGGALLGDGPVKVTNGVATLACSFGAGAHGLRAAYSGDENFLGGGSQAVSYNVAQAAQDVVSVTDSDGNPVAGTLEADYGDEPFVLHAAGGSGTGGFVWSSGATAVASVDKGSGEVTVVSVGQATITVMRTGDDNHNDSEAASFVLDVSRRSVSIAGVAVKDKVYDGKTLAEFVGAPDLVHVRPGDEQSIGVSLSSATAFFDSADAGEGKTVLVGGFALTGAKIDSYELVGAPSSAKATIEKATPEWGGRGPAADGGPSGDGTLAFGQRLSALGLSGGALDINGDPLDGDLDWAPSVNVAQIPGDDAESASAGLKRGYAYDVVFTPAGALAVNYHKREGTVTVAVAQASPFVPGGGAPAGSTIFSSVSGRPETLSDSAITGDVVFTYDGAETAATGGWGWDDYANGYGAGDISYADPGIYHPYARFTPDDPRIAPLSTQADVAVYSPRSKIDAAPGIGPATYGSTVSGSAISAGGLVLAVSADLSEPVDITELGGWSWKNPEALITSRSGSQQAVLVFTPKPGSLLDWDNISGGGYVVAEANVDIPVKAATLSVATEGAASAITLGDNIGSSLISGYAFGGAAALGHTEVAGDLAWEYPDAVPGQGSYATDGRGNDPKDGVFYAKAVFTPDDSYGGAYEPYGLYLPVKVNADKAGLTDVAKSAAKVYDDIMGGLYENYDEVGVDNLQAAIAKAKAAESGDHTQSYVEQLAKDVTDALKALAHSHPVTKNSASGGVGGKGSSVEIGFKGQFETVEGVTLDEEPLAIGAAQNGRAQLAKGGKAIGGLSQGSAVVTLLPAFVDTLPNGTHRIDVFFEDAYGSGYGETTFVIDRPADDGIGGKGGGKGNAGGKGGGKGVAKPTAAKVKVTFNANGGKASGKPTFVKNVKKGSKLGKLRAPARKGYRFGGWYTKRAGGKRVSAETRAHRDATYYAHWKKKALYGKVAHANSVFVRRYPSMNGDRTPIVGHMKRGQEFRIAGKSSGWYTFKYKGATRYVYAKYVKEFYR